MTRSMLLTVLIATPWILAFARTPVPDGSSRMRFVDLPRVIRDHQASLVEYDAIDKWRTNMEKIMGQRQEELKKRGDAIEQFDRSSREFRDESVDLRADSAKLQYQGEALQVELEERTSAALRTAYERSIKVCSDYLDENIDVDVIFQVSSVPVAGKTREKVVNEIVVREVTAYRPELDITEAILTMLNKK